jgi:hypothetical protein
LLSLVLDPTDFLTDGLWSVVESISVGVASWVELRMVSPCRSSIWVLILGSLRVILYAVMPLPLVEFLGQTFGSRYLVLSLPLDLFNGLLRELVLFV